MMCWAIVFDFVLNLTIKPLMPPNLLVNVDNLDVVNEGVAWAFNENLNKFEWFIKFCKGEFYEHWNLLYTFEFHATTHY